MVNIIINTVRDLSDREVSEIGLTSSFESIGFDDLSVVELIMKLEDKFGFSADIEMYETETIGELVKLIMDEN